MTCKATHADLAQSIARDLGRSTDDTVLTLLATRLRPGGVHVTDHRRLLARLN